MGNNKRFELERQLHEQYAINNNANLASIIILTASLLSVFGLYGYIFIHSNIDFADDWGSFVKDGIYSLDVLLFTGIATFVVFLILFYLVAYLGVNQRKEQFIAYSIRKRIYTQSDDNKNYSEIFPTNYHPFNKTKSDFIQGLYGAICCILRILFWLIAILSFMKIGCHFYKYCDIGVVSYSALVVILLFVIFFILSLVSFNHIIERLFQSYKERENEYLDKKWGKQYNNKTKNKSKWNSCLKRFF